jgi:hypothetical protein
MIKIFNILLLSVAVTTSLSAQWKKQGTIKGANSGYWNIQGYPIQGNDIFLDTKATKAYKADGAFWKSYSLTKNADCLNSAELLRIIPSGLGTTSDFSLVGACNTFNGNIQYVTDEKGVLIKKFGPPSAYTDNGKTYFVNATKDYFVDTLRDFDVYKMNNNGFTLDKTFTNIRTFNPVATDNPNDRATEKYFYTISKENKMTIYDRAWTIIGTIQLPQFSSTTQAVFAYEISQKKYNDDTNWEVEILFISKTYEYTSALYDSNGKILLKTKNFIHRDKNYAIISTPDSMVIYKAKGLVKLKTYTQNKPSYDYMHNTLASLFLSETNNADSTIKVINPDGTALKTLSFKGNPFAKTVLNSVIVIGQGNNTFALLKEFKHNADKFKSYEIVYPSGASLKLDGNYSQYSKLYNDTQARIYFEKDNGDGTSDYEIYNYGTYSPAKEIAVLEGVKVFPNPFNDAINIQLPKDIEGKSTIIISNMLGKTFGNFESSDSFVVIQEAANFPVGFYLISIENNGKRMVQKLIKN